MTGLSLPAGTAAPETNPDLSRLGPGATAGVNVTETGPRRGDFAEASLVSSSIAFVLEWHVRSNNSVGETARNASAAVGHCDAAAATLIATSRTLMSRGSGSCPRDEPHTLTAVSVGLQKTDAARLKGAAHRRCGRALQRVLPALEATNGTAAHLRAFGKLVLRPIEEGSGGPALRRRKGHGAKLSVCSNRRNTDLLG